MYIETGDIIVGILLIAFILVLIGEVLRYRTAKAMGKEIRKISEILEKFSARMDSMDEEYE